MAYFDNISSEILPSKPKHAVVGDDELEDIVKPREAELADVKKPPQMTKRRKIKITAPSMPDVGIPPPVYHAWFLMPYFSVFLHSVFAALHISYIINGLVGHAQ